MCVVFFASNLTKESDFIIGVEVVSTKVLILIYKFGVIFLNSF